MPRKFRQEISAVIEASQGLPPLQPEENRAKASASVAQSLGDRALAEVLIAREDQHKHTDVVISGQFEQPEKAVA